MTGLDFPGLVSAIVFTRGCNFHCPYCHNARLIPFGGGAPGLAPEEVLAFLKKRSGLLDGLVISGGEPTLQSGLAGFCRSVKELGYQIKLDTNGSRPGVVSDLLERGLADYVALDCKTLPDLYGPDLSAERDSALAVRHTLRLLQDSDIRHEVRTTCAAPFVSDAVIDGLLPLVGETPWFLQKANLSASMREKGLEPIQAEAMEALRARAAAAGARIFLR